MSVEEPQSRLRRLLKKAEQLNAQLVANLPGDAPRPPESKRITRDTSPVRPTPPAVPVPQQQLAPRPRATQEAVQPMTEVEERLQAEAALEKLRQKTAYVAAEFAEGKLNRAQFVALYAHYNEKRTIIERLLARNPGTSAWQPVATPGHTMFLRTHFEARVLSFAIYDYAHDVGALVTSQGSPLVGEDLATKIARAVAILRRNHNTLSPQRKPIEDGHWAVFVPGSYTIAIIVFSLEPSALQVTLVQDLQRDFERANRTMLERGVLQQEQLVFPHRALFEKTSPEQS